MKGQVRRTYINFYFIFIIWVQGCLVLFEMGIMDDHVLVTKGTQELRGYRSQQELLEDSSILLLRISSRRLLFLSNCFCFSPTIALIIFLVLFSREFTFIYHM